MDPKREQMVASLQENIRKLPLAAAVKLLEEFRSKLTPEEISNVFLPNTCRYHDDCERADSWNRAYGYKYGAHHCPGGRRRF